MSDWPESMYVPPDGEPIPVTELLHTENIQETGTDWFRQDGIYKRHMALEYLPNDISVADLRALVHVEGVKSFQSTTVPQPHKNDTTPASTTATRGSMIFNILEESKIFRKARQKILKQLADDTTEETNKNTVRVSILFRIEAESKEELYDLTRNVEEKANELGAEVTPVQEPPEIAIRAMQPPGDLIGELGEKYSITVDAAIYAAMQFPVPPEEQLEKLSGEQESGFYI